jgi:hypothetical protein
MDPVPLLEEVCTFGEDRVYLLMAIARRKENPGLSGSGEIVFREVLKDDRDLDRTVTKLGAIARGYDDRTFRLYVSLNARNVMDAFFRFRATSDGWLEDRFHGDEAAPRKFKRVDSHWYSELQRPHSRDETRFLWDLDDATETDLAAFRSDLPVTPTLVQSTPNGYHVVTEPFDYQANLETAVESELKTDGMLFVTYLSSADG